MAAESHDLELKLCVSAKRRGYLMKILALEKEVANVSGDAFHRYLKAEAFKLWELYQAGVIREIYFRGDVRRAVLMLECGRPEEALQVLDSLPLVREGLISFEILPLIAYSGFSRLFSAAE